MRVKKERKPIRLICVDCGCEFIAYNGNALRCTDCRKFAQKQRNKESMAKKRTAKYCTMPKMTIREVLREKEKYNKAHGTNLSYGQFVQMMGRVGIE